MSGQVLSTLAISTALSIVMGLWLAWLLVNRHFPGRRELGALATAALALPAPVICYYAFFNRAYGWSWGLGLAVMLASTPMLVRAGRMAFSSLDPVYANAARTLGASEWRVFWRIEVPRIWRLSAAAAAVAFARVLAELIAGTVIAVRLGR
ncbi:MAG TPA: ABC transporter permease subunit [Bryobacteraceae bacterium]